jgi:glycosyltransferase involved in cell wall biosynthesis
MTGHYPLISCVMLTADRPKHAARAIKAWRRQTWPNRELIIYDSGSRSLPLQEIEGVCFVHGDKRTIGEMRNAAIARSSGVVIAHWDDDDVSCDDRLRDEFDRLTNHDCEITGYSSIYFHREKLNEFWLYDGDIGEPTGTSLMYRRRAWDNRRFAAVDIGEDLAFCHQRYCITAYGHRPTRIVAGHHGDNTSSEDGRFIQSNQRFETAWSKITCEAKIAELSKFAAF